MVKRPTRAPKRKSSKSSSSSRTEASTALADTLELGRLIADEIGSDGRESFTAKWMAHFLAERIDAARSDPSVQQECVDLILRLWRERRYFPNGDPFAEYEPLLVALRARVLSEPKHIVEIIFDDNHQRRASGKQARKLDTWLDLATEIDTTSSVLISAALRRAALDAGLDKDKILALASEVEEDTQTELLVEIRTILDRANERSHERSGDPIDAAAQRLTIALSKFKESRGSM